MDNPEKKSPKEASDTFHNIMKASVTPKNRLYRVTFDANNNPDKVTIEPFSSNAGHGFGSWHPKTFYSIFICVNASNENEAKQKAKEIADKRVENNK